MAGYGVGLYCINADYLYQSGTHDPPFGFACRTHREMSGRAPLLFTKTEFEMKSAAVVSRHWVRYPHNTNPITAELV